MSFCRLTLTALAFAAIAGAQVDTFYSVPPADAPDLAARGPYAVGVRTLEVVNPQQPDILQFDKATGKAPLTPRALTLEVWYPAALPPGAVERVMYSMILSGPAKTSFTFAGKALRDAPPVTGKQFPLVVVSHGYPGSRFFLSYLTENLASKGYVVAAIDHTDSVLGNVKAFPSTLLNRSNDQLFTLDSIAKLSQQPDHFLHNVVDASRAAVIGYSMGGYGALATAGAGYSKAGVEGKAIPGDYIDSQTAASPGFAERHRDALKAVVAISPWGNQPAQHAWDSAAFAGIHIPALFIAGDQDDISDYRQGILPAFQSAVNSERCLLVYENARHNVGGNPAPPEALGSFQTREFFEEPVWRKDRIMAINQHFITAFLDLTLKGDESRRAYLHTPTEKSNEGQWQQTYWKGFQRRWALGLEMHCSAAQSR